MVCWWNSPWNIRIQNWAHLTVGEWFINVIRRNTTIQTTLDEEGQLQFIHFAALVLEQIWLFWNKVRIGSPIPDWQEVSRNLNKLLSRYWKAERSRRAVRTKCVIPPSWTPPLLGELKFNMDIAFTDYTAISGILVRNHFGNIVRAWSQRFPSPNPFCAELAGLIQAFKLAEEMQLEKANFECDSLGIILALQGLQDYEDWQARDNLKFGKMFLSKHVLWSCKHVNRICNYNAHNFAQWAKNFNFCGDVSISSLPNDLFCDRDNAGTSNVHVSMDDDIIND